MEAPSSNINKDSCLSWYPFSAGKRWKSNSKAQQYETCPVPFDPR